MVKTKVTWHVKELLQFTWKALKLAVEIATDFTIKIVTIIGSLTMFVAAYNGTKELYTDTALQVACGVAGAAMFIVFTQAILKALQIVKVEVDDNDKKSEDSSNCGCNV